MAADRPSDRPSNKNKFSAAEAVAGAAPGEPGPGPALERRQVTVNGQTFPDRRSRDVGPPSGLERRRGPGRRLSDFTRAAEEGELTPEQFLFLMAIEGFKKANNKVYPSWTDVLEVVRLLGYRKTMPSEIKLRAAEDWQEAADAPAEVRPKRRDAA
jgi:hypothetical protein